MYIKVFVWIDSFYFVRRIEVAYQSILSRELLYCWGIFQFHLLDILLVILCTVHVRSKSTISLVHKLIINNLVLHG